MDRELQNERENDISWLKALYWNLQYENLENLAKNEAGMFILSYKLRNEVNTRTHNLRVSTVTLLATHAQSFNQVATWCLTYKACYAYDIPYLAT